MSVKGWRATLQNGFRNAFPQVRPDGPRLEIATAELVFEPTATAAGGTSAVRAEIRYVARLLDPTGRPVRTLRGTAVARASNTSASELGFTRNAMLAVEDLYERLARALGRQLVSGVAAHPSAHPRP